MWASNCVAKGLEKELAPGSDNCTRVAILDWMKESIREALFKKQNMSRVRKFSSIAYHPTENARPHQKDIVSFALFSVAEAVQRVPATEVGNECNI